MTSPGKGGPQRHTIYLCPQYYTTIPPFRSKYRRLKLSNFKLYQFRLFSSRISRILIIIFQYPPGHMTASSAADWSARRALTGTRGRPLQPITTAYGTEHGAEIQLFITTVAASPPPLPPNGNCPPPQFLPPPPNLPTIL